MKQAEPKPADDMRMPAEEFDQIMRKALESDPQAEPKKPVPAVRQARKVERPAKK